MLFGEEERNFSVQFVWTHNGSSTWLEETSCVTALHNHIGLVIIRSTSILKYIEHSFF